MKQEIRKHEIPCRKEDSFREYFQGGFFEKRMFELQ